MKRFTLISGLLIALVVSITVFLEIVPFQQQQQQQIESTDKLPGALKALQMWSNQRTYPQTKLSGSGYSEAFEQLQLMKTMQNQKNTDLQTNTVNQQRATDHWTAIGPHNTAGRMLAVVFNPQNPSTIFAGSASGGLWVSHSAGLGASAWSRIETGHPVLGVSSIAIHPADSNTMYIGTGEVYNYGAAGTGAAFRSTRGSYGIGILKTTDGGLNWTKSLDWSADMGRGVNMIKINPLDKEVVYAATSEGVYKSIDGGGNWSRVHSVLMATDLLIHPADTNVVLVGCGNFGSLGNGIYRSANGGASWTQLGGDLPTTFNGKIMLSQSAVLADRMYASIGNGFSGPDGATWLCRSDDGGQSFKLCSTQDYSKWQGWFAHDVAAHPTDSNVLMTIGIDIWRSTNGGNSLTQVSSGSGFYSEHRQSTAQMARQIIRIRTITMCSTIQQIRRPFTLLLTVEFFDLLTEGLPSAPAMADCRPHSFTMASPFPSKTPSS